MTVGVLLQNLIITIVCIQSWRQSKVLRVVNVYGCSPCFPKVNSGKGGERERGGGWLPSFFFFFFLKISHRQSAGSRGRGRTELTESGKAGARAQKSERRTAIRAQNWINKSGSKSGC